MKPAENVSFSDFTTFKIGGKARYFFRVRNLEEIKEAVEFAKNSQLPIFVLGGGSNLLVSDEGFSGVVIKNEILGLEFKESDGFVLAKVGAGENWDNFVKESVSRGLYGIENLSGIPGTVGASAVQNIGAYGVEVKDTIYEVETLNSNNGEIRKFNNADCHFDYRESFFKTKEGKNFIILSVTFKLKKDSQLNLDYKDLKNYFSDKSDRANLASVREAVLEIRSKKFPDLNKFGTAGSFFKNPIISKDLYEKLKNDFPDLPGFQSKNDKNQFKVSLAWIIDNVCQLKGFSVGRVGLFERQPIVVVNTGGAKSVEVEAFVEGIIEKVYQKTGIRVAWEVEKL